MRKFLFSTLLLLPCMMVQAQIELTPQQQLEQAQKQYEEAQKALEAAKASAAAARVKAQADSIKAETERIKAETEKMKETAGDTQGWVVPKVPEKKVEKQNVVKTADGVILKDDPKYLAGAVPVNDEGKVEFVLNIDANGKSAAQIYDILYEYMSNLTQEDKQISSRVALVNKGENIIANTMNEWLVFSSSFISLDQTEFKYNLIAKIQDNHLNLTINHISYNYEEGRSTGFKSSAEDIIVDKVALTKKKNALAKIYGKFRKATIDRKDAIFNDLVTLIKQ